MTIKYCDLCKGAKEVRNLIISEDERIMFNKDVCQSCNGLIFDLIKQIKETHENVKPGGG